MTFTEQLDGLINQVVDTWFPEDHPSISCLITEDYARTWFVRELWFRFLSDIGTFSAVVSSKKQSDQKIHKSDVETHLRNLLINILLLLRSFRLDANTIVEMLDNWAKKKTEGRIDGIGDEYLESCNTEDVISLISKLWHFNESNYLAANELLFEDIKNYFYIEHIVLHIIGQIGTIGTRFERWDHQSDSFFQSKFEDVLFNMFLSILRLFGLFNYQTSDLNRLVDDWKSEIKNLPRNGGE